MVRKVNSSLLKCYRVRKWNKIKIKENLNWYKVIMKDNTKIVKYLLRIVIGFWILKSINFKIKTKYLWIWLIKFKTIKGH